jgi:hypothetical protein
MRVAKAHARGPEDYARSIVQDLLENFANVEEKFQVCGWGWGGGGAGRHLGIALGCFLVLHAAACPGVSSQPCVPAVVCAAGPCHIVLPD